MSTKQTMQVSIVSIINAIGLTMYVRLFLGWTPLHEGKSCHRRFGLSVYGKEKSPFPLAVTKNQFKAARLLLKSGANSNAPGPEGQTPLVDAVLNNNSKVGHHRIAQCR
jgi:hypothetical protein